MTLTEFLLARIAEDEADALNWQRRVVNDEFPRGAYEFLVKRVKAECAAKRRIASLHEPFECCNVRCKAGLHCVTCEEGLAADGGSVHHPCPTYRAVAAAYSAHPDYRDEWRP